VPPWRRIASGRKF